MMSQTGDGMNEEKRLYFRNILESWLEDLLHQADDTVTELRKNEEKLTA